MQRAGHESLAVQYIYTGLAFQSEHFIIILKRDDFQHGSLLRYNMSFL